MAEPIRILLADDHAVLRAGLRALLEREPDLTVVGEAAHGEEALEKCRDLNPDVVVLDITMPGADGLETTRRIAALQPDVRIVILTMHPEEHYLVPVLEAGASGYVHKARADEELIEAIRTAAGGEVFLYPEATRLLLERVRQADEPEPGLERLTDRERQVLALTAEGFSSSEIGERLIISPKTVDTYRSRIMRKLDLQHRSQLVRFALRTGLLRSE